ncbi:hypothetical protein GCM10027447_12820 [Glycomyces halotolerans]
MTPNVLDLADWTARDDSMPRPAPKPEPFSPARPIPPYPPEPKCGSHAYYWVVSDASQRLVCGPHLHLMLALLYTEHPVIAAEEPEPGQLCEYPGVAR